MIREDQLSGLIGKVYDAALDEKLWLGLAPEIARAFDSSSATIHVLDRRNGGVYFIDQTANIAANIDAYCAHHWRHDAWAEGAVSFGIDRIFLGRQLIPDRELLRTEFYNDWCRKADQRYIAGGLLSINTDEVAALAVHRPKGMEPFEESDRRLLGLFAPHLQRALQLRGRLRGSAIERQAALDALDRSGLATLVVGRQWNILYANPLAERLLREAKGICAYGGRLHTVDRRDWDRLSLLIRAAIDAGDEIGLAASGGVMAIARDERLPLTVSVAPFRPAREGLGALVPAAILFIRDPEQSGPTATALQGLLGLTPTETAIAAALAEGQSVSAIAKAHRISLNTARTHMKSVFAKSGTSRQAELVALILRSIVA